MNEKYVTPFNFNKLYKIFNDTRIEDIAKMSSLHSLKSQDGSVHLNFPDKKRVLIPYKN